MNANARNIDVEISVLRQKLAALRSEKPISADRRLDLEQRIVKGSNELKRLLAVKKAGTK